MLAEKIENIGRDCVEAQDTPEEALSPVARLRPLYEETLTLLEREASPVVATAVRRPMGGGFGRRGVSAGA